MSAINLNCGLQAGGHNPAAKEQKAELCQVLYYLQTGPSLLIALLIKLIARITVLSLSAAVAVVVGHWADRGETSISILSFIFTSNQLRIHTTVPWNPIKERTNF